MGSALIGIGSAILDAVFFPASGRVTESLVVQRDGTPIIQAVVDDDWQNRTFRTLDGKPVVVAHLQEQASKGLLAPLRPPHRHANLSWERRVVMVGQVGGHDNWYIWHDGRPQGHAYLIGYDIRSKQKIGYIGRRGFRPDEPPPDEQFPVAAGKMLRWYTVFVACNFDLAGTNIEKLGAPDVHLFDWHWFLADDGLLRINLKERTVEMVKKGGDFISATPFEKPITAETSSTKGRSMAALLVRTPDRILVMEFGTGKELASYPIPEKLRHADIHWYQFSPDRVLVMSGYPGDELFWFDAAGKIVRREHVDLKKPPPRIPKVVEETEIALAGPSPATIVGFLAYYPWNQNRPESMDYWPALIRGASRCAADLAVGQRNQHRAGLPLLRAAAQIWTVVERRLDHLRVAVRPAGLFGLPGPSLVAGPPALSKLRAGRPARSAGLFRLRPGVPRAGAQGDRSLRVMAPWLWAVWHLLPCGTIDARMPVLSSMPFSQPGDRSQVKGRGIWR